MHIQWVELIDFRNYPSLSYLPATAVNILAGSNAQGKTNLLEGLSVLLSGRSFRTPRASEIPRWGTSSAWVSGTIRKGKIDRTLKWGMYREEPGRCRIVGDRCPWTRAVTFGCQDLSILSGPPQARRNALDAFTGKLFPQHLRVVSRYRRVLARRNHILQTGRRDPEAGSRLAPWDEQLSVVGAELLVRRRQALETLQGEFSRLYPELAGRGEVRLIYQATTPGSGGPGEILDAVRRRREEELARGQSVVGPHRDDLRIDLDGVDMRVFGSRGQQRLLALILRLAEVGPISAMLGSSPVLLLDDALSELDPTVQAAVARWVGEIEQVFLTTADPAVSLSGATRWEVERGAVEGPIVERVRGAA